MDLTMKYTGQGTLTDAAMLVPVLAYSAGNSYSGTGDDDAGNVSSGRWLANAPTNSNPAWIRYDFGVPKISEYMIQSQNSRQDLVLPKIGLFGVPMIIPTGLLWTLRLIAPDGKLAKRDYTITNLQVTVGINLYLPQIMVTAPLESVRSSLKSSMVCMNFLLTSH